MIKKPQIPVVAFTTKFNGLCNKLFNEVYVESQGKRVKSIAQWDTGATGTCVSDKVVDDLQLIPTGQSIMQTPSGTSTVNNYCIDLLLPNNVMIRDVRVMGSEIGKQGLDVLIGMDVILLGDFAVSSHDGHTQFSFRIPSLSDADFVSNKVDGFKGVPVVREPKIQPNDKCPCGSGLKYKQCCGKNK